MLLPLILILAAALAASLMEEQKKLLPRFGDRYREYRQQVHSFFFPPLIKIVLTLLAVLFAAGLFV